MIYTSIQKYIFLPVILLIAIQYGSLEAQSLRENIDSLKFVLAQTEDELTTVDIYNELAFSYRRSSLDTLNYYTELALELAQKLTYKHGLLLAYKNQGIYRYKSGFSSDSILYPITLALKYANETGDYYNQAALNNNIGLVKAAEDKHRESVKYYLQGLKILHQYQHPPSFLEGLMNGNLSVSYRRLKEPAQALTYAKKVNAVAEELNDPSLTSIFANSYGCSLIDLGQIEKGRQYLEESIALHEKLEDYQSLENTILEIARAYIEEGDFTTAESYINRAQQLSISQHFNTFAPYMQLLLARIHNGKKDYAQALEYVQKAIAVAKEAKIFYFELQGYELLTDIYKNMEQYEEAFNMNAKVSYLNDSINVVDKSILIEDLETRYQVSKKEQEIEFLNKNKAQQNLLIKVLGALVLVSIALFFIFFRWRLSTIKNQRIIENKNEQLKNYIDQNLQLENFAYIASHDLKTPLRNIISFSQLLERKLSQLKVDNSQVSTYLYFITNGSKELMNLTQDLLEYSTLNKKELQLESFQIDHFIDDFLQSIQSLILESNAQIELEIPKKWVTADSIKLKQVFQNIIINAIKFHSPGTQPFVSIQMTESKEDWTFSITDRGIGIAPEFHEKIFLLLKRLHNKDEYEGTGMGLAIAKRVVEQHGGRIWLESAVGKGSSFHFNLPKQLPSISHHS